MSAGPGPRARFRALEVANFDGMIQIVGTIFLSVIVRTISLAKSPMVFIQLLGGESPNILVFGATKTFPIISFIMSTTNHSELTSTENQSPFSKSFSSIFVKTNVLIGLFQYVDLTRLHIFVYNEGSMNEIHYVFVPIHIV